MTLLDRYILRRFFVNFGLLFALLFMFAAGIDLILNLDEFVKVARDAAGADAEGVAQAGALLRLMIGFEAPRVFLFYASMHGLLAIGAMGFTLAQMHRHREVVALMSSGTSLHRVAVPFLVATFAVSALQLLNQDFVLHRVAPRLLRGHGEAGQQGVDRFAVRFVDDGEGRLFQSPSFDPATAVLVGPTILERDPRGRTVRRITAERAQWNAVEGAWRFEDGLAITLESENGETTASRREPIDRLVSDLDPRALMIRRYGEYAGMLSLRQIRRMLEVPQLVDVPSLLRHRYARFAAVLVNLLVIVIALPSFLLREPASLLRQSILCAAMALPAIMGAALGMHVEIPGIPPAAGVFLPVVVLLPVAAARWTMVRT